MGPSPYPLCLVLRMARPVLVRATLDRAKSGSSHLEIGSAAIGRRSEAWSSARWSFSSALRSACAHDFPRLSRWDVPPRGEVPITGSPTSALLASKMSSNPALRASTTSRLRAGPLATRGADRSPPSGGSPAGRTAVATWRRTRLTLTCSKPRHGHSAARERLRTKTSSGSWRQPAPSPSAASACSGPPATWR